MVKTVLLECSECDVIFEGLVPDDSKSGDKVYGQCPECETNRVEMEVIVEEDE